MGIDNKRTLYILGNGFDCCHGLETSPERFLEILSNKDIYNEIDTARTVFEKYNVSWSNFEISLADIDLRLIVEEQLMEPDYYSDHEYDRDGGIFNMEQYTESLRLAIKESLETMVDNANQRLIHKKPALKEFLNPGDAVLSFNYTSTLEKLYNIPNGIPICHIHGFRAFKEHLLLGFRDGISEKEFYSQLGYSDNIELIQKQIKEIQEDDLLSEKEKNDELQYWYACYEKQIGDRDYYVDMQLNCVFQFYELLKKKIQISKLTEFLEKCKGIERVVVMGHSMSSVDSDYMEIIEEKLCPFKWDISQYCNDPSMESISIYSFAEKVNFYDLYNEYSRQNI